MVGFSGDARELLAIKSWLKFYTNGTLMIIGTAGYIAAAAYDPYPMAGLLLLLFVCGGSIGFVVAVIQCIYGVTNLFRLPSARKYYLNHCKGAALWLAGFACWVVGVLNGYVLTA